MRRRDFIAIFGGLTAGWPLTAQARQATPVIGFLSARSQQDSANVLAAWREGLEETGYVEGRNLAAEYRWAEGRYDRISAFVADLIKLRVTMIVTAGGDVAALPVKAATSTIPIVFVIGSDPVRNGLVESLARPGNNVTGVTLFTSELGPKRLSLLRQLVPTTVLIGVLFDPSSPAGPDQSKEIEAAAHDAGQQIVLLRATNEQEIDAAFADLVARQVSALIVMPDPFFNTRREQIVGLASRRAVPAIYDSREYVLAGGLMSYGTNYTSTYHQAGVYTGRILKGAKPADLPVLQPTKFDLVINLKVAKALGLTVPLSMQQLADEVIE